MSQVVPDVRALGPAPGKVPPPQGVLVPATVLDEAKPAVDGAFALRLVGAAGGVAFARPTLVDSDGGDVPRHVRIGRLLWTELGIRPGEAVSLEATTCERAAAVSLAAPFYLSSEAQEQVMDWVRKEQPVAWDRARLSVPTPGSGESRVLVRVRAEGAPPATPLVIDEGTTVQFSAPDPDLGRRRVTFAEVGGLTATIDRLRELIELPLLRPGLYSALGIKPPRGIILWGPAGTGKTLLSKGVASELSARTKTIAAAELVGSYSGETEANLRELFSEAARHAPTLIVIDEIDILTTSRGSLASQSDIRATTQLLSLMDGLTELEGVVVLGTTNRLEAVDTAFRRPGRFDEEVYVGPPNPAGRVEIVGVLTRDMPLTTEARELLFDAGRRQLAGMTGADLMKLVREIGVFAARRLVSQGALDLSSECPYESVVVVEQSDVEQGLASSEPSAMRDVARGAVAEVAWDDLVGMEETKQRMLDAGEAAISGSPEADGVLLTGPPGNGKSLLSRALSETLHANLVVIDGSSVFTQWLGESEAALRRLFDKSIEVSPAVVVVEHLDAIAPARLEGSRDQAARRVFSALLSSLDRVHAKGGVLVVGITDRPELVDEAVTRSGRLGHRVEIPMPDRLRREQIVLSELGTEQRDPQVQRIVQQTNGATAAEVVRACRQCISGV